VNVLVVLLAQTDAPQPLLPDTSAVIWPNVALLVLFVAAVGLLAWRAWVYLRDTRRTADQALKAVTELHQDRR